MARKELIATQNKKSAKNPAIPVTKEESIIKNRMEKILPTIMPLRANSLGGIKGSSIGVIKAPDTMPETRASMETIPLCNICEKEKIPGPIPAMSKRTRAVIKAGLRVICNSRGVRINLS